MPVGLLGAGFEEWVETIQSKVPRRLVSAAQCGLLLLLLLLLMVLVGWSSGTYLKNKQAVLVLYPGVVITHDRMPRYKRWKLFFPASVASQLRSPSGKNAYRDFLLMSAFVVPFSVAVTNSMLHLTFQPDFHPIPSQSTVFHPPATESSRPTLQTRSGQCRRARNLKVYREQ